jgi:putative transposase
MRGGARKGAGRKRIAERPSVPHVERPEVKARHPLLITVRLCDDVPNLRERSVWEVIVRTFRAFRGEWPLAIVHYAVLANHLHMIAESEGRHALARGMQALCTRLGKALNRRFGRSGTVFAGRYHARELATPLEVRNALQYVLLNARKHSAEAGIVLPPRWFDDLSTAAIFDGWRTPPQVPTGLDFGTLPASTWLLRVGWRMHGPLDLATIPGGAQVRRAA